ncbi:hypothetical protein VTJ83DRAFT_3946 [Remersonia thermophila]|uniref:Uncharacterized protein n=1 Tax=Remersonia thermophila TaxID=72144 RepID=A0ABR4DG18_9PEZI
MASTSSRVTPTPDNNRGSDISHASMTDHADQIHDTGFSVIHADLTLPGHEIYGIGSQLALSGMGNDGNQMHHHTIMPDFGILIHGDDYNAGHDVLPKSTDPVYYRSHGIGIDHKKETRADKGDRPGVRSADSPSLPPRMFNTSDSGNTGPSDDTPPRCQTETWVKDQCYGTGPWNGQRRFNAPFSR